MPFERCAYIVNLNSDGTNKYYNFHRLQTAIRWDPVLKYKKVITQVDHDSDEHSVSLGSSNLLSDIPMYHVEMGYWPHKGSFFYFNRAYMWLIHDPNADMTDFCMCPPDGYVDVGSPADTCEATENRCDTSRMIDPCARDTPLFATGVTPLFNQVQVSTSNNNNNNHAIAFEIVFDSIFVIFNQEDQIVYRVGGTTYDNLIANQFYILSSGAVTTYGTSMSFEDSQTITSDTISTICSMDFHGLFLGVTDATKVIRLELDIATDGDASMESTVSTQ